MEAISVPRTQAISVPTPREVLEKFRNIGDKIGDKIKDQKVVEGVIELQSKLTDIKTFIGKTTIKVAGVAGEAVAILCPADGPLADIAVPVIGVALDKAVDLSGEIEKKSFETVTRVITGVEKTEQEKTKENPIKELLSKKTEDLTEEEKNQIADQYVAYLENQQELEQQSNTPTL